MTSAASGQGGRAVVIGASIAGLLAARVLSETYVEVLVVDRDDPPLGPVERGGVPQARHPHWLLARGREVVEELFPGITDDLVGQGAGTGDVQQGTLVYAGHRPMARGFAGVRGLVVSRPRLDWAIRERVAALPEVTFLDRTSVLDLVFSPDRRLVTGLVLARLDGLKGQQDRHRRSVEADLVVDASGRNSRTPEWLERGGYDAPEEQRVRVESCHVTRRFRRLSDSDEGGARAILHAAVPGTPRVGTLLYQEQEQWGLTLVGYAGVRPPTDLAAFVTFARSLCSPVIADTIEGLQPLGEAVTYRFSANVRRRYERLDRFPGGLVVIGDALCTLDPTFGQGMSLAAIEALELRDCLRESRVGLARHYFAKVARHVDSPWAITVGCSAAAAGVTGRELDQSPITRAFSRYLTALSRAAVGDPILSGAFMRVANLADPPRSLLAPRYIARVLLAALGCRNDPAASRHTPHRPGRTGPVRKHQTTGQQQ